jgi:hypothetical protein
MDKDQEIQDIVNQLEGLQIQQSNLLERLGRLSESGDSNNNSVTPLPTAAARAFAVGDRVRILNPNRLQPDRGAITKIGRSRITVEARNGTKIIRAPRNLILEN